MPIVKAVKVNAKRKEKMDREKAEDVPGVEVDGEGNWRLTMHGSISIQDKGNINVLDLIGAMLIEEDSKSSTFPHLFWVHKFPNFYVSVKHPLNSCSLTFLPEPTFCTLHPTSSCGIGLSSAGQ